VEHRTLDARSLTPFNPCKRSNDTTIKIATEFRNVGDGAYAMSHAAAEACTQRLAAGRGHEYRLAAPSLQPERGTGNGPARYRSTN